MRSIKTSQFVSMFQPGGFVDFDIESGGASLWLHAARGELSVLLLEPSKLGVDHLIAYKQQAQGFLSSGSDLRYWRGSLPEGTTIVIPSGTCVRAHWRNVFQDGSSRCLQRKRLLCLAVVSCTATISSSSARFASLKFACTRTRAPLRCGAICTSTRQRIG
jgi:hypothetical protein